MAGWWGASIAAAMVTLSSEAPRAGVGISLALSADFVLKTTDAQGSETVTGAVRFIPGGEVCVAVKTPRLQEMRLSLHEMVIYYPDRDLALVANVVTPHAPPMLDALAAGVADPGSTLPPQSKLIERKRANGNLSTRWRVIDGSGQELGEMRSAETREGAVSLDLYDKAGKPQRRFSFGDRVRVGGRSVPRTIGADYFAAGGARQRQEQWTLANVTRFDAGRAAPIGCAHLGPHTKIQELPW
jgi:hypothetical protein